jgi:predicted DsbA family dithiol-disulfide isomerase
MARSKKSRSKNSVSPLQNGAVQVDIVSDVVCPWCWLGYRLFDKARKQARQKIELTWRPYMLDPEVPAEGVDYKTYMKNKFGEGTDDTKNRFKAMREMLEEKGPDLGIDFAFDTITRRPNTLNAHRLIRWAQNNTDMGSEISERLFKAFFTEGEDIGDIAVLARIGADVGLDADITADLLATDKDANTVREEILFFRNLGISGVPTFIYNGQFAVQGAQDPNAHLKAISQAAKAGIPE